MYEYLAVKIATIAHGKRGSNVDARISVYAESTKCVSIIPMLH